MTHNANKDARDGVVTVDSRNGGNDWDVLFIPNTIRSIRAGAYRGATNIREIQCEEGDSPLTIYEGAFEGCVSLQVVELPGRVETIQDECFAGCSSLSEFTINPGLRPMGCGFRIFDGCPNAENLSQILKFEQDIRNTPGLGWHMNVPQRTADRFSEEELKAKFKELFALVKTLPPQELPPDNESYFVAYVKDYRSACEKFLQIDWRNSSANELKRLFCDQDNGVALINNGTYGFQRVPWREDDFQFYREVSVSLLNLENTPDCARKVYGIRKRFYDGLPPRDNGQRVELKVVFNRVLAALNPSVVVQVPDNDNLHLLLNWLYLQGVIQDRCHFHYDDWFESSAAIRHSLNKFVPPCDDYELGVFAWILTEALLQDPSQDSRQRQEIMRPKLQELGLLAND